MTCIREELEKREHEILSPFASFSDESKGRDQKESPCDIRPAYQRDRDRILHCKSFRRLIHKTQVFLTPSGDHYRTRLTHTLEVSQIARTISKALRLNEDLTEAIALGHDLGHTPFGHSGEDVLDSLCENGFKHNEQSVRIVEKLEKDGAGLNLNWEVRDGIKNHQMKSKPATLEGKVVRLSDKIAYIHHDVDDAIRGRVITEESIPIELRKQMGMTSKDRLNTLIHDIIDNSKDVPDIRQSDDMASAMIELRSFMYKKVYTNSAAKGEEDKAKNLVKALFNFYKDFPGKMAGQYVRMLEDGEDLETVVCDYIAGMTDQYAISKYNEYFVPKAWHIEGE